MMDFSKTTVRIMVQKDYAACFDFYTEKLGLVPIWEYSVGDKNGPYTTFAAKEGGEPCLAIFNGKMMPAYKGYTLPKGTAPTDTIEFCIPSDNIDEDYKRLKEAGVEFIGEPQTIEDWGMRCVYFRDTEGNLLELSSDIIVN